MSDLKRAAIDAIDKQSEALHAISHDIWSHPELNFKETHAHAAITDFLEKQGFPVERNFVLETGFRSVLGSREHGPHIALLCEYDALPEIGHACGHNLIAEVGLAAGIGIKTAYEANGQPLGKLTILGTPAEEDGGGKIDMVNAGVFKDVDVAMMAHPTPYNSEIFPAMAVETVKVMYHGKAAHAAAFPWEGVNALDAAVLCYQNVSCMRQQFKPTWRVHGVILKGGTKPNIIPHLTEMEFYARTTRSSELETLKAKLDQCFEAAAKSTGCSVEVKWEGRAYLNIINNSVVSGLYKEHAIEQGIDFVKHGTEKFGSSIPGGSTDMGNVSYEVPSIHPMFYIGSEALNHHQAFTAAAGDPKAQSYTLSVSKAIALTAIDILTQKDTLLPKIKEEFHAAKQNQA